MLFVTELGRNQPQRKKGSSKVRKYLIQVIHVNKTMKGTEMELKEKAREGVGKSQGTILSGKNGIPWKEDPFVGGLVVKRLK